MNRNRTSITLFGVALAAMSIVGCSTATSDDNQEVLPTIIALPTATTLSLLGSQEDVEGAGDANNVSAPSTPEVINNEAVGTSSYYAAVSYTVREGLEDRLQQAPPEGQYWLLVVSSLGNGSSNPITVQADSLYVIDSNDNRYQASILQGGQTPSLVGGTIDSNESLYGFAYFAINSGETPVQLKWCPTISCNQPIISSIPQR